MLLADYPESNWAHATDHKSPTPLQACTHCNGRHNADCPKHGIAASNARQSEFYRKWNERHGD
jgi:hypothetical protein